MNTVNRLSASYSTIKTILNTAPSYYVAQGDGGYDLFVVGESLFVSCHIFGSDSTSISDFQTNYKSKCVSTVSADDALILGNAANGIPLVLPRLTDGRIRVSSEKTNSSTVTFYSYDWTDKTTWYLNSILVSNETLTDIDGYVYKTAHPFIIDTYHGKLTTEDYLKDSLGNSYRVSVKVNGVVKTEQDPHYGNGGDYTINYNDGYINFINQLDLNAVVSATYHYATNSVFVVAPTAGKQIRLSVVEIQFSADVILNDTAVFQPYGFVDYFAPQYLTTNGGPYPPGTKIPLGNPLNYKSMQDYLNDSKKAYPLYPPMGGAGWRGMTQPAITLDWDYEGEKILRSDQGMEIRAFLQHDCAFQGSFATATFYCRSENLENL